MRTIKHLYETHRDKGNIYIYLKKDAMRYQFLVDAWQEGFTFGDGIPALFKSPAAMICLTQEGYLVYPGTYGAMGIHLSNDRTRVDYEKYIHDEEDYLI